jgi:hypothetical protein
MEKRGQYAAEYMVIFGFSMLMIIAAVAIYQMESNDLNYQVNTNQAYNVARKVVDSAEQVYHLGKESSTKIKVYIPKNIVNTTVRDGIVLFKVMGNNDQVTEVYASSQVNISGSMPRKSGYYEIKVESKGAYVWVS